jgi:hypothetical protein
VIVRSFALGIVCFSSVANADEGIPPLAPLISDVPAVYYCADAHRTVEAEFRACFSQVDFGPYRGRAPVSAIEAGYRDGVFTFVSIVFGQSGAPSEEHWKSLEEYIGCIESATYRHRDAWNGNLRELERFRLLVKDECSDHSLAVAGEPMFDFRELDTELERMQAAASELARMTITTVIAINDWPLGTS